MSSASIADAAPPPDGIAICAEHLQTVHRALESYRHDHGQLPDQLSDLIPKYLPDTSSLHCPADPGNGELGSELAHRDPKMPISYSYEYSADLCYGLPSPLGPFPKPDIPGTGWGTCRLVNTTQERFYGDQVPVVRCFHHRPPLTARDAGAEDLVLNLTPSGKVYHSTFHWEDDPDAKRALMDNLDHDLIQGAAKVKSNWMLGRVNEHVMDLGNARSLTLYGSQIRRIAQHLAVLLPDLTDEQRVAHHIVARFDFALGEYSKVLSLLDAAAHYNGADWHPTFEAQLRGETYHALKQYDKEIAVYQELLAQRPNVPDYMRSIADAYDALGKADKAKVWRMKADPGLALVGNEAPDIPLQMLSGVRGHLKEQIRGKKAFLVNFWFCGCYPCQREMPHLQALYTKFKDQGFDLVCIDYGDEKDQVQKFVTDRKLSFPVALGSHDRAVFDPFSVDVFPTSYLLDSNGKVVWRGVGFGPEALQQLPAALATLGLK